MITFAGQPCPMSGRGRPGRELVRNPPLKAACFWPPLKRPGIPGPPWTAAFVARRHCLAASATQLPAIVREGLVGLGHAVRPFTLLGGAAAAFGGLQQLGSQLARHRGFATLAGSIDDPAHR